MTYKYINLLLTTVILSLFSTACQSDWSVVYGRIRNQGMYYAAEFSFSWPSVNNGEQKIPCNYNACWFGVSITNDGPLGRHYRPAAIIPPGSTLIYHDGDTLQVLYNRWVARNGTAGTMSINNWMQVLPINTALLETTLTLACFQYWPGAGTGSIGINIPGGTCGTVTPPVPPGVSCASLPSMLFDFGVATPGRTNQLRSTKHMDLQCTDAISVTLRLQTELKLSPSLGATMTVNGRTMDSGGVSLAVVGNTTPLEFVVTTNGNENNGGVYTASSVLTMEYR